MVRPSACAAGVYDLSLPLGGCQVASARLWARRDWRLSEGAYPVPHVVGSRECLGHGLAVLPRSIQRTPPEAGFRVL